MKIVYLLLFQIVLNSCRKESNKPENSNGTLVPKSADSEKVISQESEPMDSASSKKSFCNQSLPLIINTLQTNGTFIETPAVTNDGKYFIVKFHNYSCCFDEGEFYRLYNQNKEVWTIQTHPSEDVQWSNTKFDSVNHRLRKLLNTRSYHKMTPLNTYKIDTLDQISETQFFASYYLDNVNYRSEPFNLESINYEHSRCCLGGYEDQDYECKIAPEIKNIWIDNCSKIILLEYGIIHDLDGCDRGPFFKSVTLNEDAKN